jgi:hypothetical protein
MSLLSSGPAWRAPKSWGPEQQRLAHEPALKVELARGQLAHRKRLWGLPAQPVGPARSRFVGVAVVVTKGFHAPIITPRRFAGNEPIGSSCVQSAERSTAQVPAGPSVAVLAGERGRLASWGRGRARLRLESGDHAGADRVVRRSANDPISRSCLRRPCRSSLGERPDQQIMPAPTVSFVARRTTRSADHACADRVVRRWVDDDERAGGADVRVRVGDER